MTIDQLCVDPSVTQRSVSIPADIINFLFVVDDLLIKQTVSTGCPVMTAVGLTIYKK